MSSSPVRPVASAASNMEPGSAKPAVGQRPDEALEAARHAGRQVVDRLEDRADGPGRGDLGDRRRQLGAAAARPSGPRGARRRRSSRTSGRGACSSTAPRRPGGRAPRGRARRPGRALMPAENDDGVGGAAAGLAVEAGGQQPADDRLGLLGVGVGHQERELVAADAEGPVAAADVRRDRSSAAWRRTRSPAAWPLESLIRLKSSRSMIASASDRPAAGRHRPLPLDLLLERPVVAEAGQGVAQGFGAGAVVGVLEDAGASARGVRRVRGRGAPARRSGRRGRGRGSGSRRSGRRAACPAPRSARR